MGKSFALEAGLHAEAPAGQGQGQGLKGEDAVVLAEVGAGGTQQKLTSRGAEAMEDVKRAGPNGCGGANGSGGPTGNRNPPAEQ